MVLKRNILAGKNKIKLFFLVCLVYFSLNISSNSKNNLEGSFTDIKILNKINLKKFWRANIFFAQDCMMITTVN